MYLDSSLFICSLLYTNKKADEARKILNALSENKFHALTSCLSLDEILWIVWKKQSKKFGLAAVRKICEEKNLRIVDANFDIMYTSFEIVEEYDMHPRDAIHAATMRNFGTDTIVSDDAHFDKVDWIKRFDYKEFLNFLKI